MKVWAAPPRTGWNYIPSIRCTHDLESTNWHNTNSSQAPIRNKNLRIFQSLNLILPLETSAQPRRLIPAGKSSQAHPRPHQSGPLTGPKPSLERRACNSLVCRATDVNGRESELFERAPSSHPSQNSNKQHRHEHSASIDAPHTTCILSNLPGCDIVVSPQRCNFHNTWSFLPWGPLADSELGVGEQKDFEVYSCHISPDGSRLATAGGGTLTRLHDPPLAIHTYLR